MKKNILVVAIATAMIAPATTMAGASFYGHAQAEIGSWDYEASNSNGPDLTVEDRARGRIGMTATEDLGNGWKGLAKFEFKADTSDGDSKDGSSKRTETTVGDGAGGTTTVADTDKTNGVALTPRDLMVGLKGPMGQIELGRLKSAYKYTGGVKYDALVTTMLEARGNGGMTKPGKINGFARSQWGTSSFVSKHFGYRKKMGPVKLSLTYGPSTDDGSITASAMFKKGGIEAFLAIVDGGDYVKFNGLAGVAGVNGAKNTVTDSASYAATKIGGKFKTGGHSIMFQYEMVSENSGVAGAADFEPTQLFLGYNMKMGKNVFVLNYGAYDSDTAKNDLTYTALAVIHKFSKKTRVFAGYRATTSDKDTEESVISVGMRKTFKGG